MSNDLNLAKPAVRVHGDIEPHSGKGRVADCIPALARVDPRQFGLAIVTCEGETASDGDGILPIARRRAARTPPATRQVAGPFPLP